MVKLTNGNLREGYVNFIAFIPRLISLALGIAGYPRTFRMRDKIPAAMTD